MFKNYAVVIKAILYASVCGMLHGARHVGHMTSQILLALFIHPIISN